MSRSSNFQNKFMSYDFIRSAKSSGFTFTCYKERVEWDRLAAVDLDRVVRDVDIGVLQDHVSTVVRCDLGELRGIDPGLVKLVRLAQLCLEYCLFCQEQLAITQTDLEQAHEQAMNELEAVRRELKSRKEEIRRRKKYLTQEKENIVSAPFYQCGSCPKAFSSPAFLESHVQRRHSTHNTASESDKWKLELEELKTQLEREREEHAAAIQAAKEAQLAREESLWVQVEKTQAEQRLRHQSEILELTHTFQSQLKKQLTEQVSSEPVKSAVSSEPSAMSSETSLHTQQAEIEALHLRLSQQKEEEVMQVRVQTEQIWRERLENLQAQHRLQVNQLNEELEHLRTKEQGLLAMLEAQEKEFQAAVRIHTTEPKPSVRKRADASSNLPASSSKLGETFNTAWQNEPSINNALSVKKSPPRSGTPPSAVPRRKLQLSLSQSHGPERSQESKPSSESESTTSEESQPQQSVDKMKVALQQNPEIMKALRSDVEMHVGLKLAELGVDDEVKGLGQRQATQIASLTSHHRKLASKKFADYATVREEVESLVSQRLESQHPETVSQEANLKPSKVKKSNFLSKLYHRRKSSKKREEVFTSTPIQEQPQSILKVPRDWPHTSTEQPTTSKSAPSSPSAASRPRTLERAQSSQSLPAPKAVTFASPEELSSPSSFEESGKLQQKQERPKSAFQSSKPEPARTPISGDIFLAIPKLAVGDQKNTSQNLSDLAWDLEDL